MILLIACLNLLYVVCTSNSVCSTVVQLTKGVSMIEE